MKLYPFSYAYYCDLIASLKEISPLKDFSEITPADQAFFILRHDVEFSLERALDLAKLEHEALKIQSSYFIQTRNNTYNILSRQNRALIKEIYQLGHTIGLHVNSAGFSSIDEIRQIIKKDIAFFSHALDVPMDRFSFHRPTPELLQANLKMEQLINAYGEDYFQYDPHFNEKELGIYYFSDSEHSWKYNHPFVMKDKKIKKFQLLTHPDSWSTQGADNLQNFKALIEQKYQMMLRSIDEECHHFPRESFYEKL
jgi:hypothetical protein